MKTRNSGSPGGKDEEQNCGGGGKRRRSKVWKVYVSGFHDWPASKNEVEGFDQWRCLENPSGRLFIGRKYKGGAKPDATKGPLPKRLVKVRRTADGRTIEWTFDTLPVKWGVAKSIKARDYDVVVNLGYGVYDSETRILLELGAFNRRAGQPGADGRVPGKKGGPKKKIAAKDGRKLQGAKPIRDRVKGTAGTVKVSGKSFKAETASARSSNDFICNETHYIMLKRVRKDRRPRRAFFIHIPKPRKPKGYALMAEALTKVIRSLIQP